MFSSRDQYMYMTHQFYSKVGCQTETKPRPSGCTECTGLLVRVVIIYFNILKDFQLDALINLICRVTVCLAAPDLVFYTQSLTEIQLIRPLYVTRNSLQTIPWVWFTAVIYSGICVYIIKL